MNDFRAYADSKRYSLLDLLKFILALSFVLFLIFFFVRYSPLDILNFIIDKYNYPGNLGNKRIQIDRKTLGDVLLGLTGLIIAGLTAFIAYLSLKTSNLVGKQGLMALEEFRPILTISDIENNYFRIENKGSFEGYDIKIFLKGINLKGDLIEIHEYKNSKFTTLGKDHKTENIDIKIGYQYSCIILYKNVSTDILYVYGTNMYSNTKLTVGESYIDGNISLESPINKLDYFKIINVVSLSRQIFESRKSTEIEKEIRQILGMQN